MKKALYPGSFDPLTNGHIDIIKRAAKIFDGIIVAVGHNNNKSAIFTVEERIKHLQAICNPMKNVEICSFKGLLTEAVKNFKASVVIRGLRAVSDFEWEFQMALMNRELAPECETLFLMPSPRYSYVSSTMIKEIAKLKGDISAFVPKQIIDDIYKKLNNHKQV